MAQLVAHLLCKQGVTGSSPVGSTRVSLLKPSTHLIRVGAEALDECCRRTRHEPDGHRGRKGNPYTAQRTPHTGADFLADRQRKRPITVLITDEHVQFEATWGTCQRLTTAYPRPHRVASTW